MSTAHIIAQLCMLATLILMITGKTPIYMTAIVGAAISALIAGFPMAGGTGMTVTKMIVSGLNPVIADMTGILLFIGIMQATGFLDVIIRDIVRLGNKWGGGVGVACAGGVAAGVIGALTGFTQPVITAVICGPAAVRLGVRPNQSAGMIAHAGHIGNLAGFTHPTQVAILATAGIGYGLFNVLGFIAAGSIFVLSAIRATADMRRRGIKIDAAEKARIIQEIENREYSTTSWKAFFPFLVLVIGFICGLPIFLVGMAAAIVTMMLAHASPKQAELDMMKGVSLIATPLVATIGFLFMSTVIREIGMVQTVSDFVSPVLSVQPVLILFAVAVLNGLHDAVLCCFGGGFDAFLTGDPADWCGSLRFGFCCGFWMLAHSVLLDGRSGSCFVDGDSGNPGQRLEGSKRFPASIDSLWLLSGFHHYGLLGFPLVTCAAVRLSRIRAEAGCSLEFSGVNTR